MSETVEHRGRARLDVHIRWKRGTAARWAEKNPILSQGEPGIETDTDQFKVGDGFRAWNDLGYASGSGGGGSSDTRIGALSDLTTENKTSIVGAINELNAQDVSLLLFYENAKAG